VDLVLALVLLARNRRGNARRRGALPCALLALVLGCATPVGVRRVDIREVYRTNTESVLTTERPSVASRQVLLRLGIFERFRSDPAGVLRDLHERTLLEMNPDNLFALAEYSELYAERRRDPDFHVAAALYAYAFLFPDDGAPPPDALDPRTRTAASLYNRAIASAFAGADDPETLEKIRLPEHVGRLELTFDASQLIWAERSLTDFVPASNLEVRGLRNRYRRPGIGAAFAPLTVVEPGAEMKPKDALIADDMRPPVALFVRFEQPRAGLLARSQRAALELYNSHEVDFIEVAGQRQPAEFETTAALALSLDGAPIWDTGVAGFRNPAAIPEGGVLRFWGPHQTGRVPVVFIHGTASSPARWAEMLNEFESDPLIRTHYEPWFFTYPTGSPIVYSAALLRRWLEYAVSVLDPEGDDESLRRMVLIGHSQGGLLAKLQVIDSGTRFWDGLSDVPFDQLELRPETRAMFSRALFLEPLPFVHRVIFIATPHRGAFIAASWQGRLATRFAQAPGQLVSLPIDLARAGILLGGEAIDVAQGEIDEVRIQRAVRRLPSSIDDMNPASSFIQTLAGIPLDPSVIAHSIIPVTQGPPPDGQNDGVVDFEASRVAGAHSEFVVFHAGHSVQSNPEAIQEVRRILLEQLAESP